jgi:hypothetical protein
MQFYLMLDMPFGDSQQWPNSVKVKRLHTAIKLVTLDGH